jgi:hypothetical protein
MSANTSSCNRKIRCQPPRKPLVNDGGVEKTIAQHRPARGQRRRDHLVDVFGAIRHVQKQFRRRGHAGVLGVQQNGTNRPTEKGAAGLPGASAGDTPLGQPAGQVHDLGGFAGAFAAFQRDKHNFS